MHAIARLFTGAAVALAAVAPFVSPSTGVELLPAARAADDPFAAAAGASRTLVRVDLLANTTAIKPGEPFDIAVRLRMAPHWHVYWINPGDAGMATSIDWTLPEGFTASDLRWPAPIKFMQPGDLVGYGYEGAVLLLATITPPATAQSGESVELAAHADWLVCRDQCVKGDAGAKLTLPIADAAQPAHAALFDAWRARLPEAPGVSDAFEPAVAAGANGAVRWSKAVEDVDWYPATGADLIVENVRVATDNAVTTVRFDATVVEERDPPRQKVPGVLVFRDGEGERRAVAHEVSINPAK